ncbi:alpha-galactosidase [Nonomuraea turkmeniaca]|uniref:alpha-galactosidase n=1 Tax=Nonomuraea turkmeniaca TaxID=103838 RepID=UPI001B86BF60|nr:alpha-galactosidase [Nonomuraea turkmeniaca]
MTSISWGHDALRLEISDARLTYFGPPGGAVLDRVRERGMVPGLWLEPEVIGVRSPLAESLPDEAFFRRDGIRVTDNHRHHLDLRHPAARAHLDRVGDRLVGELGIGYLKLDHNIDPGSGTSSRPGETPAAGLLGHNRAHRTPRAHRRPSRAGRRLGLSAARGLAG